MGTTRTKITPIMTAQLTTILITLITSTHQTLKRRWPISNARFVVHSCVLGSAATCRKVIPFEIDRDLCAGNGEGDMCDSGTIGPNMINYGQCLVCLLLSVHRKFNNHVNDFIISVRPVNALFMGANSVYKVSGTMHIDAVSSLFQLCTPIQPLRPVFLFLLNVPLNRRR